MILNSIKAKTDNGLSWQKEKQREFPTVRVSNVVGPTICWMHYITCWAKIGSYSDHSCLRVMTQLADMPLGNSKSKMSAMALLFCLETRFIGNHLDPKTFIEGPLFETQHLLLMYIIFRWNQLSFLHQWFSEYLKYNWIMVAELIELSSWCPACKPIFAWNQFVLWPTSPHEDCLDFRLQASPVIPRL